MALDEIEEPLIEAIDEAGVGEFDGNEIGPDGATLYMYAIVRYGVPAPRSAASTCSAQMCRDT